MIYFVRIFGVIMLLFGIFIIAFSVFASFRIFTGAMSPPEVFSLQEGQQLVPSQDTSSPQEGFQEQAKQLIQEQIQSVLPQGTVPKMLNLMVWSFLAGLFILAGSQASGLGIKLIAVGKESSSKK